MDYQPIHLNCQCGESPSRIAEVGLSATRELVIHWWCGGCNRVVYTTMALAECWEACPKPDPEVEEVPVPVPVRGNTEADDESFLRSLGVRFAGDDEF